MHIVITAGGTREYIDPVRFISNASSGKMGYALARAALRAGHKVTLITAPTAQRPPAAVGIINVETAAQMFEAVKKYFPRCDCLIMAAAVADYAPVRSSRTKLKKSGQPLTIELKPTRDILKWAASHRTDGRSTKDEGRIVVGFALEDRAVRARAEKKLHEKGLDMIVANSPAAINADKSDVQIKIAGRKWLKFPRASKRVVADRLIRLIEESVS
jgi:phosphopantothenoylcysteine decarboxylase/phosphopantothenate--cysteine ligase